MGGNDGRSDAQAPSRIERSSSGCRARAALRDCASPAADMVIRSRSLIVATCAICAGLTFPAAASATYPGSNGLIAYASQSVYERTWTSRPDGGGQRRILARGTLPQFTADGRQLVYVRSDPNLPAGKQGVYIAAVDGSVRTPIITTADVRIGDGAWSVLEATPSPDGRSVAFTAAAHLTDEPDYPDSVSVDEPSLYVVSSDGRDLRLLVTDAHDPTWSPDGRTIAYIASHGAVATIAPDGSGQRTVVAAAPQTPRAELDFSPDGTRLVLTQRRKRPLRVKAPDRRYAQWQIAIADLAAGTIRRLPAAVTVFAADAVWSPDGSRIAYVTYNDDTRPRLFLVRPDGTGRRIAFRGRPGGIHHLAWQPLP
jgi:Tol biopolymer transport system component